MKPVSKKVFADYEMARRGDGNGRTLVYIGNTYTADIPEIKYIKRKRLFAVMLLICVVLFAVANLQPVESNMGGPIASIGVITVLPLFLACYGCISGIFKKMTMTRGDYIENSMFIKFGAFFVAIIGYVECVWRIIFINSGSSNRLDGELTVLALWLLTGIIASAVWGMEISTKYIVRNRYGSIIQQEHFRKREAVNHE